MFYKKKFISQKLNYIHNNPCSGKWLIELKIILHSSAGFYQKGVQGIFAVDNIMDLMDIDLRKKS